MTAHADQCEKIIAALRALTSQPIPEGGRQLFETLGYISDRRIPISTSGEFREQLAPHTRFTGREQEALDQLQSLHLLFQFTDSELDAQMDLLDDRTAVQATRIESYLFFAAELPPGNYNRTLLSTLVRAVNKPLPMPALLLIRHGDLASIGIIHRRMHKRELSRDVLEKVTLIKDIRCQSPHRAHIEILHDLSLPVLVERHECRDFVGLHEAWRKTLDTNELNKRFYRELADWYFWALDHVDFPDDVEKNAATRNATNLIRLLTRLVFCWFLKEKGLIPDNLFNQRKLADVLKSLKDDDSAFYRAILQNLFFGTLNQRMNSGGQEYRKFAEEKEFQGKRHDHGIKNFYRYNDLFINSSDVLKLFEDIPFLNGGLFDCLDKEDDAGKVIYVDGFTRNPRKQPVVPNFLFFSDYRDVDLSDAYHDNKRKKEKVRGLINLLQSYKFTVTENTPIEEEIALDPELLGKVFENLLASYNPETGTTARKQTGSFYTPREIVHYMVDESLKAHLTRALTDKAGMKDEDARTGLDILFAYTEKEHAFSDREVDALIEAIDECKILDPACGSGAFPMGILHKLVFILGKLDPLNERWKAARLAALPPEMREKAEEVFNAESFDYTRKLELIKDCIYGVDIQPIAIQISKLRFFISLICDQRTNRNKSQNCGVRPLPNLETKFVAANTLIGIERPDAQGKLFSNAKVDKLKSDLSDIRHRMFTAKIPSTKQNLRERDKETRLALAEEIRKSFGKANEDEIYQTRIEIEKIRKTLGEELSKPVEWEITRFTNLFGETEETRIEKTKEKKHNLRKQIKHLESSLCCATHRDSDIDSTAEQLAAWDPYDQNASADFFDPEWMFGITDGFDVVIGNPPYGADIPAPQLRLIKSQLKDTKNANSAAVFIDFSKHRLVKMNGVIAFIVPKSLLFSEKWLSLAQALAPRTVALVDVEQAFENVLLEQVVFVYGATNTGDVYTAQKFVGAEFVRKNSLRVFLLEQFKTWLCDVTEDEISVALKMRTHSVLFSEISKTNRGLPVQGSLKDNGAVAVIGGKNVQRYSVNGEKGYLNKSDLEAFKKKVSVLLQPKIVSQNIVAHIANPLAHIQITSALDLEGNLISLDTVNNTYVTNSKFDLRFLLALLNSRLTSWYAYRFVFANAIRTMHFDEYYVGKLPIPNIGLQQQSGIIKLVESVLAAKKADPGADTSAFEAEINRLVYSLYSLTPEEIGIVEGAGS